MEGGNLREALAWFIDHTSAAEAGLRLVGALSWFWTIRSTLSESWGWQTMALHGGKDAPSTLRTSALFGAAGMAWYRGNLAEARLLYGQSIALNREVGVSRKRELVHSLTSLGMVAAY